MGKFRTFFEEKAKEEIVKETPITESEEKVIDEKVEANENPIRELRKKGFVIKKNIPTKNGRELTFFKEVHAIEAYNFLVKLGYDKSYQIVQTNNIIVIEN